MPASAMGCVDVQRFARDPVLFEAVRGIRGTHVVEPVLGQLDEDDADIG